MIARVLPYVLAVVAFVVLIANEASIVPLIDSGEISLSGLYSSVFGWSAIQTGFLFSVYGFIAGKQDGFVGAIKGTPALHRFANDLLAAIVFGFLLTIFSMPLIVYPPSTESQWYGYTLVCFWFSLFILAFSSFCRVAFEFGIMVRVPDSQDRLAH